MALLFVFCFQARVAVVSNPYVSSFELRGLPPLSLIIAFGPVSWQEMRDLFYLAWTTLFLPDYWCYFTPNNMTLRLLPAQGQSLRVTGIFKRNGERKGEDLRGRKENKRQRQGVEVEIKLWCNRFGLEEILLFPSASGKLNCCYRITRLDTASRQASGSGVIS